MTDKGLSLFFEKISFFIYLSVLRDEECFKFIIETLSTKIQLACAIKIKDSIINSIDSVEYQSLFFCNQMQISTTLEGPH